MRRKGFLLLAILCCLVLVLGILAACNESGSSEQQNSGGKLPGNDPSGENSVDNPGGEDPDDETESFTITFDTQGGSNIADITVGNGQVIGEFTLPTKQCARFVGFALDAGGERMWNLQTDTVSADITLYAIWKDAHAWGEWETVTEPTCTAEGTQKRICKACGEEETESVAIIEHDFIIWEYDENHHWKICSRCGAVSEKTAHVYDMSGKCECGAIAATPASEFTFTDLGNNTWRVDGYYGSDSEIVIPSRYNGGKVISIGDEAFFGCTGLTSVTIPDSVTSIGHSVFSGCSGLTSITIPGSVTSMGDYAFYYCSGLTSVTIGDGVTSIGDYVFYNCSGLTSITIPGSVTSIGNYAFYYCSGLTSVTIGDGVTNIGRSVFSGCSGLTSVTIPYSVTSIGSSVFFGCTGLTSVTIGNGVTSIEYYAFYGCSGLASVTIGDGVTSIGNYAFYDCSGLTSVTIGDGVTSIGDRAFYNCSGLTSVTIGDGVTSLGRYAFYNCSGLTSITIPDGVMSIGSSAFGDCYKLVEVYNKSSLDITAGSTSNGDIGYYAKNVYTEEGGSWLTDTSDGYRFLYDGTNGYLIGYYGDQTELTLPAFFFIAYNDTEIAEYGIYDFAFYKCSGLTSVTIPGSVTNIGSYAFEYCTGLTFVTIGDGVTSIGDYAFRDCDGLTSVTFEETSGWFVSTSSSATSGTDISADSLSDKSAAARYLRAYFNYYWKRNA